MEIGTWGIDPIDPSPRNNGRQQPRLSGEMFSAPDFTIIERRNIPNPI
jgi:hypothetical protein